MKKISLFVGFFFTPFIIFSQSIRLNTNGNNIILNKVDTLFYSEYKSTKSMNAIRKRNDLEVYNQKNLFGIIMNETLNDSVKALSSKPEFTTNFYVYEDKTLQAPTRKLFIRPANADSFIKKYKDIGKLIKHPTFENYYYLYISDSKYNSGDSIINLCNRLYEQQDALVVEPIFIKYLKTENPYHPKEWNIKNTGLIKGSVVGADMNVENAWKYANGLGIKVAIIDDGVDLKHPDLKDNLLKGFDATGNKSEGAPDSTNGHGTNCAGIIGSANNIIGTIGIAYNSKIIPIRMGIVSKNGIFSTTDEWIANCFIEAVKREADVISNSWGGGSPSVQVNEAIEYAVVHGRKGKGCVILFAAGNANSSKVQYPATNPSVIAVGASTPCDTRKSSSSNKDEVNSDVSTDSSGTSCDGETWWGSNFGEKLDVVAPGVLITTTDNTGSAGFDQTDYNDHFNGTSAACPNAAGVVALVLSANANLTRKEVTDIIEQTCFKIAAEDFKLDSAKHPNGTWCFKAGYGRLNAELAVYKAKSIFKTKELINPSH